MVGHMNGLEGERCAGGGGMGGRGGGAREGQECAPRAHRRWVREEMGRRRAAKWREAVARACPGSLLLIARATAVQPGSRLFHKVDEVLRYTWFCTALGHRVNCGRKLGCGDDSFQNQTSNQLHGQFHRRCQQSRGVRESRQHSIDIRRRQQPGHQVSF